MANAVWPSCTLANLARSLGQDVAARARCLESLELARSSSDKLMTGAAEILSRHNPMTAAILRGEWRLTGEAIKLDDEGRVRDGQNRFHAIVQAGVPVRSVVARGVSQAAFDVMDTGRSRNAAGVLGIHGYPSQNALAAGCSRTDVH